MIVISNGLLCAMWGESDDNVNDNSNDDCTRVLKNNDYKHIKNRVKSV